jgi:hypothetical protein
MGVFSSVCYEEVSSLLSVPRLYNPDTSRPAANLLNCTEAVQVTKTNDRLDISSEGAPDIEEKNSNSQIVINIWS